ncbi:MAG: hypothetical protein LBS10_05475 [Gracilibacteraceae bacterium]|jgi:sodium-dependent dicarboxylate transporter 2/3/5|nr:hypothetical protein [Gracilibacteraceae bacterium]
METVAKLKLAYSKELPKFLIFVGICAAGWLLSFAFPPSAEDPATNIGLTQIGIRTLFVFLACVYGWSITTEVWPSMLAFCFLPLTGSINTTQLLAAGFGSDLGFFTIVLLVFIAFLTEIGVPRFIANWMLTRRILAGHPWRFFFTILIITWFLSTINTFMSAFLMWSILYGVFEKAGYKKQDKFPTYVFFGIGLCVGVSLSAMPWSMNAIVLHNFLSTYLGIPIDVAKYLAFSIPFSLISIIVYLILCKFVFRVDLQGLKNVDMSFIPKEELEVTPDRAVGLLSLAALILMMIVPVFTQNVAALAGFNAIMASFGYAGKALIILGVLIIFRVGEKRLFEYDKFSGQLKWGVIGIIWIVVPLGSCLTNPAAGIQAFLRSTLIPMVQDLNFFVFVIIITALVVIVTNFMANMPVAMMFAPIALGMAAANGVAEESVGFLLVVACTIAWLVPSSSPAGILLYMNPEWLKPTDTLRIGAVAMVCCLVVALVCYWFILQPLFSGVPPVAERSALDSALALVRLI